MVCTGLHWISLPWMDLVQLIVQKTWNNRTRSETVGNGRKQSGKWSGQNLSNPHFFFNKHFRATQFLLEGPKVSKGTQLETVGDRTFARQKRHVFTTCSNMFHKYVLQNWINCVLTSKNVFTKKRTMLLEWPPKWTSLVSPESRYIYIYLFIYLENYIRIYTTGVVTQ